MDVQAWFGSERPRIGTILTIDHPAVVEVASLAGFDWLWVDAEHGRYNELSAAMASATSRTEPVFVRLPDIAPTTIKRYLDTGCDGIILPQVSSAADVEAIARAALYPPAGERSIGIGRAQQYGDNFAGYVSRRSYAILVQIETAAGVRNAREIVAHNAVDAVLIGPYDLSGSYGIPGQVDSAQVMDGVAHVLAECKDAGKPCGIFAADTDTAARYVQMGFELIAVGMDTTALLSAYRAMREQLG